MRLAGSAAAMLFGYQSMSWRPAQAAPSSGGTASASSSFSSSMAAVMAVTSRGGAVGPCSSSRQGPTGSAVAFWVAPNWCCTPYYKGVVSDATSPHPSRHQQPATTLSDSASAEQQRPPDTPPRPPKQTRLNPADAAQPPHTHAPRTNASPGNPAAHQQHHPPASTSPTTHPPDQARSTYAPPPAPTRDPAPTSHPPCR